MSSFNFFLLFICCLFITNINAQDQICCGQEVFLGTDHYWFLQLPADTVIECHRNILGFNDYALPDIHGWAWELNGCHFNDDSFCDAGSVINSDDWCDQDDFQFPLNDFDDDGLGTNTPGTFADNVSSPGCGNEQRIVRTWSSNTGCLTNPVTGNQIIDITDTRPPRVETVEDFSIECSSDNFDVQKFAAASAFDICSTVDLDVTVSSSNPGPCLQEIDVLFTATEVGSGSGTCNTATAGYTVSIIDSSPPVAVSNGDFYTNDCTNIPSAAATTPSVIDSCSLSTTAPTVTFISETTIPGDCEGNFVIYRTYDMADQCGNVDQTFVEVHVVDDTPPSLFPDTPNSVFFAPCQENIVVPNFSATDQCSSEDLQFTEKFEYSESHENVLSTVITDTITAVDGCGNSVTRIYTVVVNEESTGSAFIIGPPTANKGISFSTTVGIISDTCEPSDVTLVIDAGPATIAAGSDSCFQQAANGLIYCDTIISIGTGTLNLVVPSDFIGNYLKITAEAHHVDGSPLGLYYVGLPTSLVIQFV